MDGTLALWYEPQGPSNSTITGAPQLEVHFNLWRADHSDEFLDIGLRLSKLHYLSRFYLYFPFQIESRHVKDLSGVMKFERTLDAVFNTVVERRTEADLYYEVYRRNEAFVTVHSVDCETISDSTPSKTATGPVRRLLFLRHSVKD